MRYLAALLTAVTFLLLQGCRSYNSDFVKKTDEQLAVMARQNQQAHRFFQNSNFADSEKILRQLLQERTVNYLLYQQELTATLLMSGKHADALNIMMQQHQNWEILLNPELEDQADDLWHGSSDVYLAPEYERVIFYFLMALSYIDQNSLDDALRCVKYALAANAMTNAYGDQRVYSNAASRHLEGNWTMLYYVGYLAAMRSGSSDTANEFFRMMLEGLKIFGVNKNSSAGLVDCYDHLRDYQANVLLVVWHGNPPEVIQDMESDKKVIVRGINPVDNMLSAAADCGTARFFPLHIGDVNFLATTSGGKVRKNVRNWQQIIRDPEIEHLYWLNLPGSFSVLPLRLSSGKHKIILTGHNRADRNSMKVYDINVTPGHINVIHLPMFRQGADINRIRNEHWAEEKAKIIRQSSNNRLSPEISK